jgi:hypothetical protein
MNVACRCGNFKSWQPIDTAPKDKRVLLFYGKGVTGIMVVGRWVTDANVNKPRPYWTNDHSAAFGIRLTREMHPTHWMPMPEPPEEET